MFQQTGLEARAYIAAQAAPGTPAAGDHVPVLYYDVTPTGGRPPKNADPVIGRPLHNPVDAQPTTDGLVNASLSVTAPLDFNQAGLYLPHLFVEGAPVGVGPYTRTYTSGARRHAGASFVWRDGGDFERAETWTLQGMDLRMDQVDGRRRVRFYGPCSEIKEAPADPLGTPPALYDDALMPGGRACTVRKGGVVIGRMTGGTVKFERRLTPHRGSGGPPGIATEFTPDQGSQIMGDIDLRLEDETFKAFANDPHAIDDFEFEYALSASASLVLATPALRFQPSSRGVSGPGLRTERYSFISEQTALAPACTATLVNTQATYPAGS